VVVVDNLQLMARGTGPKRDKNHDYYGDLAVELTAIARKTGVAMLTPVQISRSSAKEVSRTKKAVFDSYSDALSQIIANTADLRVSIKDVDPEQRRASSIVQMEAHITKNRDGEVGKFMLAADFSRMTMVEDECSVGPSPSAPEVKPASNTAQGLTGDVPF